jgi:hypothetical protein
MKRESAMIVADTHVQGGRTAEAIRWLQNALNYATTDAQRDRINGLLTSLRNP